jgi:hypothetical protein
MITREVKTATGCLSLFFGVVLSLIISHNKLVGANTGGRGWPYYAPVLEVLDPGAHAAPVMWVATLLDGVLYSVVIFAAFYGFVKLIDKMTQ